MTSPAEQVSPVEQTSDEPMVFHRVCLDGPRNTPKLTVGCCGEPFEEGSTIHGDDEPGIDCPLCDWAYEIGCACFYYS